MRGVVRVEFDIGTLGGVAAPDGRGAHAARVRPPLLLAGFHGRVPTEAEARNVGTWAAEFGPAAPTGPSIRATSRPSG